MEPGDGTLQVKNSVLDRGTVMVLVIVEYFLYIALGGFKIIPHIQYIVSTHILYISLISYMLASLRVRDFKNWFDKAMVVFTFLFFMPLQGFITSYHLFSGYPPVGTVVVPLLTALTLANLSWRNVSSRKVLWFFTLYALSIVFLSWGMVNIVAVRYSDEDFVCELFRWWYPTAIFIGTLPYVMLGYRWGSLKNIAFSYVMFYVVSFYTDEALSLTSYLVDVDRCAGNVFTIPEILIIIAGAVVGYNKKEL